MKYFWQNVVISIVFVLIFAQCGQSPDLISSEASRNTPVLPGQKDGYYLLPNGWKISPVGDTSIKTNDMLLSIISSPDDKAIIALNSGFNPHELTVINPENNEVTQRISVPTSWFGLAWHPDGSKLYVSGGNNTKKNRKANVSPPIYVFAYSNGRLSEQPISTFIEEDSIKPERIFWSGLVHHPTEPILYAANRTSNRVVVYNSDTGELLQRIPVRANPYDLVISPDGKTLYSSNWGNDTVSVIDTKTMKVKATIAVGDNPNDMVLTKDGWLFVACSNDNSIAIIDTGKHEAVTRIVTSISVNAPEGSTPNSLALSPDETTLYVANADNNNVGVINISERDESNVQGFIPAGWYPSALALNGSGSKLFIGNSKGSATQATLTGHTSPLEPDESKQMTVKELGNGMVQVVDIGDEKILKAYTDKVFSLTPYKDSQLSLAKENPEAKPSIIPREVGLGSPIKHVIYIIKENRTYDQLLGDMAQGNGDERLAIFGLPVTPNHHALAEQFVLLDNLYCDAEVSRDGHQWSTAAYATDYVEKDWPHYHGKKGAAPTNTEAAIPASGYIWDKCAEAGLTYRSYGEMARWNEKEQTMKVFKTAAKGLEGHLSLTYKGWGARDYENADVFIQDFDAFEEAYDSDDPEKRLPNFTVMLLPEDHTHATVAFDPTPRAAVASNDLGLGKIIERVTHSRYWPELAVFVIQDDAQDGPDHVDARRTAGFVISPYTHRGIVDSTFYTTSSMLRSMELLLGLPAMSQFDAAAMPMYSVLGIKADLTPYTRLEPTYDIYETNTKTAWGARESMAMDLSGPDEAPMYELNRILWKSVKGADSEMPLPIHRFHDMESRLR